ncbi:YdeI/OmpD-associated family protein [Flavobacterium capsici]|uniref:YdeI/OmpD-associated family protein n=1 Tax=Flavobacterium capsici TaxID=3075618 RepID=A0AA96J7Q3_9FLAO|nr:MULTISPECIES: YdeI/OmpD-associated family protein [unclassified Flavobacterium]WNM18584.1 YdeI/OmpD-associated family protein [Flavobacterium sp. PMR2A8]WNM22635.1 YdeI/OmpD-associated family protein [Flavobacterium sp. PMTSA4]
MHKFEAEIKLIGINPFVFVPPTILEEIFKKANKNRGTIPIHGVVNNNPYKQTLVKYSGEWRLYINTTMLKNSPKRIGEIVSISVDFDKAVRTITPHPQLVEALKNNQDAKKVFEGLSPSRQKEIIRYISSLKTQQSIDKNIQRTLDFLNGTTNFIGREKP